MGTHTAEGEQNYLQIAQVQLPNDQVEPKKQETVSGGMVSFLYIQEMQFTKIYQSQKKWGVTEELNVGFL